MRLRELREERLLTLQEVADMTDSSIASVSNWEAGRQKMSFKKRKRFLEVFGVDPFAEEKNDERS